MSPLLVGAAGFVAGGAVAVLVFYLVYRQYVKPVVEAPWNFTAAWTASYTTAAFPLSGLDPA